jgi:hypothetical protein
VFYQLLERCRTVACPKKLRFKNRLLTLDATMIDLCAELFPWAAYKRTKGAVKLHSPWIMTALCRPRSC